MPLNTPPPLPASPEAAAAAPKLASDAAVGQMANAKMATAGEAVTGIAKAAVPIVGIAGIGYLMWNGLKMMVTGRNPWSKNK